MRRDEDVMAVDLTAADIVIQATEGDVPICARRGNMISTLALPKRFFDQAKSIAIHSA